MSQGGPGGREWNVLVSCEGGVKEDDPAWYAISPDRLSFAHKTLYYTLVVQDCSST